MAVSGIIFCPGECSRATRLSGMFFTSCTESLGWDNTYFFYHDLGLFSSFILFKAEGKPRFLPKTILIFSLMSKPFHRIFLT